MDVLIKYLTLSFLALTLTACNSNNFTFSYSGEFQLDIPEEFFSGPTLIFSNDLILKTSKGVSLTGITLTAHSENLSSNFDMASIPRVLSSTNSLNNLPESEKIYFLNGQSTLKELYGSHVFSLTDAFPFQIYSLCKELDCFVYIVKDGVSDHILNIASNGLTEKKLKKIILGGLRANN